MHRIKAKIRQIYQSVLDFFFDAVLSRCLTSHTIQPGTLLLIRLDAIGDYILFRNFIEQTRKSKRYRNYKLALLGNLAWKELAESLDRRFVDSFLWLDRSKFRSSIIYRFGFLNRVRRAGFATIVHPVYSRDFLWGDVICQYSGAPEKIAPVGDFTNMNASQKAQADDFYSQLIPDPKPVRFEFERNRHFFEILLSENIRLKAPTMPLTLLRKKQGNYAVLFPGASAEWKRWPPENFATIAKVLLNSTELTVCICGSKTERLLGTIIQNLCGNNNRIKNLCGETTLMELAALLAGAELLLSNDTSAIHIGAAVHTKQILAVFAGNHYGRFLPYPSSISRRITCFMPPWSERYSNKTALERFRDPRGNDLAALSPDTVAKAFRKKRI